MISKNPKPVKQYKAPVINKKDYTSWWLIGGLLLTLVVYFPSLFNSITNWDDFEYVNNPYIKNLSPAGIEEIFSVYFFGNYHPLTLLSLGIDLMIGGEGPFIFHFTNLLLHLLNTYLVFLLVRRLTQNNIPALLTSILFGVHPLHVESVAWVAERKDVLYSFFFLVSLIIYISYAKGGKRLYWMLSLLFFLLSLMAKGQAVVLAVILPFIDHMTGRKWFSMKVLTEKIPFLILLFIFGWIALHAQASGHALSTAYVPLTERFAFASYGFAQYLVKSILPAGLSALYPYPSGLLSGKIPMYYWLFIITFPLFIAGSYFLVKHSKIYAFGLSLFFLTLLPVLQLIPVGGAIWADRYFYMPSVGLLLCIAFGFMEIRNSGIRYALSGLFILLLSVLTISRCMVWKDSLTLWDDVISKYDQAQDAYYNRGVAYKNLKQWDKAKADFTKTIAIDPDYKNAYVNRGLAYGNLGEYDQSIADFTKVIAMDPQSAEAYFNRGGSYLNLKQWDKAIADYSMVVQLDPDHVMAWFNRGLAYGNTGQADREISDYSNVIRIDPKYKDAYYNRSIAYSNLGQWDKVITDCSSIIGIDPDWAIAWSTRGVAYWNLGQSDKSIADYTKAIEIDPKYTDAYFNRGLAYGTLGEWDKAIADYSKVIEMNPDFTRAYVNRDNALREIQRAKRR